MQLSVEKFWLAHRAGVTIHDCDIWVSLGFDLEAAPQRALDSLGFWGSWSRACIRLWGFRVGRTFTFTP